MVHFTYEEGLERIWRIMNSFRGELTYNSYGLVLYALALHNNEDFRKETNGINPYSFDVRMLEDTVYHLPEDNVYTYALKDIFPIFANDLSNLSVRNTSLLERMFLEVRELPDEWYQKFYPRLYDELTLRLSASSGRSAGEFMQPVEITKLIAGLTGYHGYGSVYNPYAGSASYAIELGIKADYYGEELNEKTYAIGVMRLIAHNLNPKMISLKDSYRDWAGKSDDSNVGKQFDYVIATPPFGPIDRDYNLTDPFRTFRRIEYDFLYRGSLSLNENGTLTSVIPIGFTYSQVPATSYLRKELIESGMISKVVLLPDGIWHSSSIQTVVICIRKGLQSSDITFVDARAFVKKERKYSTLLVDDLLTAIETGYADCIKTIPIAEVARNGYSLLPQIYFKKEETVSKGFARIVVKDVVREAPICKEQNKETVGRVLELSDLSKDGYAITVDPMKIALKPIDGANNRMTQPFIALSKVGSLRPTIVNASEGTPVFYSSSNISTVVIIDDSELYVPLFIKEWARESDNLAAGVLRGVPMSVALDISVVIPEKREEQKSLFEKFVKEEKMAKARELGLEELIVSQKRDFINVLRNRKHDLNNSLCAVQNNVSALKKCILRTVFTDGTELRNVKLAECVDTTLSEQISHLTQLLDNISNKVKHIADENSFGPVEKVDLLQRLRSIKSHGNYKVELDIDGDSIHSEGVSLFSPDVYVGINADNLDTVIENIVGNAEKHGFTDPEGKYILKIGLSYDYSDNRYVIEFKNNGQPMPNGMDTVRYGIDGEKGLDSSGSGKGGAIVKSIVEHFGGCYEVINDPDGIFPVEILIKLPKYGDR